MSVYREVVISLAPQSRDYNMQRHNFFTAVVQCSSSSLVVVDPVLLCQEKLTTFLGSCNFFFSVKKLPDVMTIII